MISNGTIMKPFYFVIREKLYQPNERGDYKCLNFIQGLSDIVKNIIDMFNSHR